MPVSKLVYQCRVELHDPVYFASREIGKLFETVPVLHNYALSYALGLVVSPYHSASQVPRYQLDLEPLNNAGIYVTPAKGVAFTGVTETWNFARSEGYHLKERKQSDAAINLPLIGHNKMLDTGSVFRFYIYSLEALKLPRWIRLGKWMSKAELVIESVFQPKVENGAFNCTHLMNPLDLMGSGNCKIATYSVFNMPPVSLIKNIYATGSYFELDEVCLPAHMEFSFNEL